ncbi:MAG: ImmA/IrrE family metallo-endopeptidase [Undibacterium sp.]|nr:ImmA/IrrE family metallo-endopeptidase [Opitutaceae bacterium]
MNQIYPERITQARELLGLTKTELACELDVSPAAVAQWENGTKNPTTVNLAQLSLRLGFPISTFFRAPPTWLARKGPISFRASKSAETRRTNLQAEQLVSLVAEAYAWLSKKVRLPASNLPDMGVLIDSPSEPEQVAAFCRQHWQLSNRPILKLGELLETNGIIVARASFGDTRIDAFSCLIDGRPFMLLGAEKDDRARSRFDAAHELGHLIMHQSATARHLSDLDDHSKFEDEANRFASAFLLPAETFGSEIVDVSLSSLLLLKERWGVSVQAMVMRCHSLGLTDDKRKLELFRQMSGKGWRRSKGEPLDDFIPEIKISVGRLSLELLEQRGVIHSWEIQNELPLPLDVYSTAFGVERDKFESIAGDNVLEFKIDLADPDTPNSNEFPSGQASS